MRYRKYEVWITDGENNNLPEYAMQFHRKTRTATCYIPSESGKVLCICLCIRREQR